MWYRYKTGSEEDRTWKRSSQSKFFSDPVLSLAYMAGLIEIKYHSRTPKQIAQWNRFKTLGDLSRTLAGMQEIVRNPLIKLTPEERLLHLVYVNTLNNELERIQQDKSI